MTSERTALWLVLCGAIVAAEAHAQEKFEGMSFHPQGNADLTVYLAIGTKDGAVREEAFSYTRVPPEAK